MPYKPQIIIIAVLFVVATATGQDTTSTAVEIVQTKSGPVKVERLATLNEPWGMTFLPDGRLIISEKPGRLRIFSDGKLSEPVSGDCLTLR
jgi:aldose sugar dehydrogenase